MFRTLRVSLILATGMVFAIGLPPSLAQTGGLKPGENLEGELIKTNLKSYSSWPGGFDSISGYAAEIPIDLKAKQMIAVSATVSGDGRRISLALMDPTGEIIASTARNRPLKTAQIAVGEVAATGKYKIVVLSDRVGVFNLRASGPSPEKVTIEALETRILQLEKELADARAKLKSLRAKLDSPLRKAIEKSK